MIDKLEQLAAEYGGALPEVMDEADRAFDAALRAYYSGGKTISTAARIFFYNSLLFGQLATRNGKIARLDILAVPANDDEGVVAATVNASRPRRKQRPRRMSAAKITATREAGERWNEYYGIEMINGMKLGDIRYSALPRIAQQHMTAGDHHHRLGRIARRVHDFAADAQDRSVREYFDPARLKKIVDEERAA